MRIIRNNSHLRRRIAGANANYFSQKNFRFRKKRAVFSPSVRRRKCEVFFADEKNFSQLRTIRICDVGSPAQMRIIFRKKFLGFEKNAPCFRNIFFRKPKKFLRKIILICAGDPPSQCDANTNTSQLRRIFLICEKYFAFATANRRRKHGAFFSNT